MRNVQVWSVTYKYEQYIVQHNSINDFIKVYSCLP